MDSIGDLPSSLNPTVSDEPVVQHKAISVPKELNDTVLQSAVSETVPTSTNVMDVDSENVTPESVETPANGSLGLNLGRFKEKPAQLAPNFSERKIAEKPAETEQTWNITAYIKSIENDMSRRLYPFSINIYARLMKLMDTISISKIEDSLEHIKMPEETHDISSSTYFYDQFLGKDNAEYIKSKVEECVKTEYKVHIMYKTLWYILIECEELCKNKCLNELKALSNICDKRYVQFINKMMILSRLNILKKYNS